MFLITGAVALVLSCSDSLKPPAGAAVESDKTGGASAQAGGTTGGMSPGRSGGNSGSGGAGGEQPLPSGGVSGIGGAAQAGGAGPVVPVLGVMTQARSCDQGMLQVTILDDSVVRFHFRSTPPQPARDWMFDVKAFGGPTVVKVSDTPEQLAIRTATLEIQVNGAKCALQINDLGGASLWKESSSYTAGANGPAIGKALAPNERIFGLGDKTGAANRRGRSFEFYNSDAYGYTATTDPVYQTHPFFLSLVAGRATAGYFANSFRSRMDVGKTNPNELSISSPSGEMDLFFFDGPSPREVLERYTRLVGRPVLPPLWALGYHQCRFSYFPDTQVQEIANGFRSRQMPADALWLDIAYMDGYRDFTFDPSGFSDPVGFLAGLKAQGFKVISIIDPGVKHEPGGAYEAYNTGVAGNHFIKTSNGDLAIAEVWPGAAAFPDFTRAASRTWWGGWIGTLYNAGMGGIWIDMNEPDTFTPFPADAVVDGDGFPTSFNEVHNLYGYLMAKATFEGALKAKPNARPFVLSRAASPGIQKYAAVWTGDSSSNWETLGMTPTMLQGLGVSGVPFSGSDVGGFTGAQSSEIYGRWFEVGAFSPFFRSHGLQQEPWEFGAEVEAAALSLLRLRYAMLPYWYTTFAEATQTGAPLVRPLWFEFPADDAAYQHDDQFFVGSSLMVAPILTEGATARDVYVPEGVYYDWFGGGVATGPKTVRMQAPMGKPPLFVRGGSIIPRAEVVEYVGAPSNGTLYLDAFPGLPGTSTRSSLYEDDGETLAYQQGIRATTPLALDVTATGLTLTIGARVGAFSPPPRTVQVVIHGVVSQPSGVSVDGAASPSQYDAGQQTLTVSFPDAAGGHVVDVKYDAATLPKAVGG
ncbi:MAG: glycoside hydrolase family 31 protein [Polyangiaceae bacterium]|nr:glycoside hydrolase family 31 protein [Polyangiaceae bacterium]